MQHGESLRWLPYTPAPANSETPALGLSTAPREARYTGPVRALLVTAVCTALATAPAAAEPIRMRYPEGPTHGFVVLSDQAGAALAHGELVQWLEREVVASRLNIRFDDGSIYDETVRFSQQPVFRVLNYQLSQRGPAFDETAEIEFDRSGRYRAHLRAAPDEEEERAEGTFDVPEDVSNGMTSILLKNLEQGASATAHIVAFQPKPLVLKVHLRPDGTDQYWVGTTANTAARFRIKAEVGGVKGVLATLTGKQPDPFYMWIADGPAPSLVRFEGALFMGGPTWHIVPTGPQWKR